MNGVKAVGGAVENVTQITHPPQSTVKQPSSATLLGVSFHPRPYQRAAIDAIRGAWNSGTQRPAVVLPTGSGKTVVFAHLLKEAAATYGGRSLVLAHREELIGQAVKKIRAIAPELRTTVVKATQRNASGDVVVASVQSLDRSEQRRKGIRDVRRVIIDECHHAPAPSYLKILDHYGCFDEGGAVAAGFTATMIRGDDKALGDIWTDVVYSRTIAEMIHEGALVRPRGLRVRVPDLNLKAVRKTAGDFSGKDLGAALEGSMAPELVAKAYAEHAPGKQGILFAPLVSTAEAYAEALQAIGINAVVVSGQTPAKERERAIESFEDGRIQVLCNAMLFTEGTDLPMAEVCVVGRPTLSKGLFIQMVGRVLRPHPGKDGALVIDVSGASERHSLLGAVDLFGEEAVDVPDESEAPEGDESEDVDLPGLELEGDRTLLDEDLDTGPTWLTGPVEAHEVDLFRASDEWWLRTNAGLWFIPTGTRYLLVQPGAEHGTWDVVRMGAAPGSGSSWIFQGAPDLAFAMALASGDITRAEQVKARKERRWWGGRKPDQRTVAHLRALGIVLPPGATAGEAYNALMVEMASRRIDPYVPAHVRARWS